jgi:hypothetical protein
MVWVSRSQGGEAVMDRMHQVRDHLLELHRALVDEERRAYEREHGKITAGEFLGVLIRDEAFAWLRPMTELIVELDDPELAGKLDWAGWQQQIRELLRPDPDGSDFQQHYEALIQRSPDVGLAHGATMRALRA